MLSCGSFFSFYPTLYWYQGSKMVNIMVKVDYQSFGD